MLWTAFILGLAGSLHCAGMCSPLVFAVTNLSHRAFANRLVYNAGRILMYGLLGAIVSSVGYALPLEEFQSGLSIGLGGLLIIIGVIGASKFQSKAVNDIVQKFAQQIRKRFNSQIQNKTFVSYLIMGSLNAFLPCGLTLIALSSTILTPTPLDGFYFMVLFGFGTLPVMLGLVSVMHLFTRKLKLSISKVNLMMLVIAGCLLIGRAVTADSHTSSSVQSGNAVACP